VRTITHLTTSHFLIEDVEAACLIAITHVSQMAAVLEFHLMIPKTSHSFAHVLSVIVTSVSCCIIGGNYK
jgi:hypothetical protein